MRVLLLVLFMGVALAAAAPMEADHKKAQLGKRGRWQMPNFDDFNLDDLVGVLSEQLGNAGDQLSNLPELADNLPELGNLPQQLGDLVGGLPEQLEGVLPVQLPAIPEIPEIPGVDLPDLSNVQFPELPDLSGVQLPDFSDVQIPDFQMPDLGNLQQMMGSVLSNFEGFNKRGERGLPVFTLQDLVDELQKIPGQLGNFGEQIGGQFENLPEQFEDIPEQFENLPEQFENIPEQFANLPEQIGEQLQNLPEQFENIPEQFANLPEQIGEQFENLPDVQPAIEEITDILGAVHQQMMDLFTNLLGQSQGGEEPPALPVTLPTNLDRKLHQQKLKKHLAKIQARSDDNRLSGIPGLDFGPFVDDMMANFEGMINEVIDQFPSTEEMTSKKLARKLRGKMSRSYAEKRGWDFFNNDWPGVQDQWGQLVDWASGVATDITTKKKMMNKLRGQVSRNVAHKRGWDDVAGTKKMLRSMRDNMARHYAEKRGMGDWFSDAWGSVQEQWQNVEDLFDDCQDFFEDLLDDCLDWAGIKDDEESEDGEGENEASVSAEEEDEVAAIEEEAVEEAMEEALEEAIEEAVEEAGVDTQRRRKRLH